MVTRQQTVHFDFLLTPSGNGVCSLTVSDTGKNFLVGPRFYRVYKSPTESPLWGNSSGLSHNEYALV